MRYLVALGARLQGPTAGLDEAFPTLHFHHLAHHSIYLVLLLLCGSMVTYRAQCWGFAVHCLRRAWRPSTVAFISRTIEGPTTGVSAQARDMTTAKAPLALGPHAMPRDGPRAWAALAIEHRNRR